jgi:hypothetical protein
VQSENYSMFMVFRTCIYYLEAVKQSGTMIVDLTNGQGLSMIIRTHIYYFEAVNQANAVTVDLWITSRLMADTSDVIWSHLSRQRVLIGWH